MTLCGADMTTEYLEKYAISDTNQPEYEVHHKPSENSAYVLFETHSTRGLE